MVNLLKYHKLMQPEPYIEKLAELLSEIKSKLDELKPN